MPTKASHYIQHRQQKRQNIDLSHLLLLLLFLAAFCSFSVVHASDTISLSPPVTSVSKTMVEDYLRDKDIKVVFSDVDGTLIHYPDQIMVDEKDDEDRIWLPPSSTGMRGVISKRTFVLCQSLREEKGVKLVLVSGMRSSTLIQRLPFLPKADAYCSEGGGRIFYPMKDDVGNGYALKEDLSWRKTMEALDAAGSDGYGPSVGDFKDNVIQSAEDVISNIPIFERKGILWEFASSLKRKGWNIDYKGYATSFRIKFTADSEGTMDELLDLIPRELSCSVNLGMSDVYPKNSGKKNWYVSLLLFASSS